MRIAIMSYTGGKESEIAANELTDDGRHVLKGLIDRLREELDELDYQELEEQERES